LISPRRRRDFTVNSPFPFSVGQVFHIPPGGTIRLRPVPAAFFPLQLIPAAKRSDQPIIRMIAPFFFLPLL
jgi:hypothetical protein